MSACSVDSSVVIHFKSTRGVGKAFEVERVSSLHPNEHCEEQSVNMSRSNKSLHEISLHSQIKRLIPTNT